jgi:hypothetical protein
MEAHEASGKNGGGAAGEFAVEGAAEEEGLRGNTGQLTCWSGLTREGGVSGDVKGACAAVFELARSHRGLSDPRLTPCGQELYRDSRVHD